MKPTLADIQYHVRTCEKQEKIDAILCLDNGHTVDAHARAWQGFNRHMRE